MEAIRAFQASANPARSVLVVSWSAAFCRPVRPAGCMPGPPVSICRVPADLVASIRQALFRGGSSSSTASVAA
jgi:hypothetical protein